MKSKSVLASIALVWLTAASAASAITYQGRFDDPTNTALRASDLSAPLFGDVYDIANNVALYAFTVDMTGLVSIKSFGFGEGGADPYFTLFSGTGMGATYVASNFDQAFSTGGDYSFLGTLTAGAYQLALGTFANMSFAENLGAGTLGDGFTLLGEPDSLRNTGYHVEVDTRAIASPVPEPSSWALLGAGGLAVALVTRRRRQDGGRHA